MCTLSWAAIVIIIIWVLQPVKIISLILSEVKHKVGRKFDIQEKKHLSRTWLVSCSDVCLADSVSSEGDVLRLPITCFCFQTVGI